MLSVVLVLFLMRHVSTLASSLSCDPFFPSSKRRVFFMILLLRYLTPTPLFYRQVRSQTVPTSESTCTHYLMPPPSHHVGICLSVPFIYPLAGGRLRTRENSDKLRSVELRRNWSKLDATKREISPSFRLAICSKKSSPRCDGTPRVSQFGGDFYEMSSRDPGWLKWLPRVVSCFQGSGR